MEKPKIDTDELKEFLKKGEKDLGVTKMKTDSGRNQDVENLSNHVYSLFCEELFPVFINQIQAPVPLETAEKMFISDMNTTIIINYRKWGERVENLAKELVSGFRDVWAALHRLYEDKENNPENWESRKIVVLKNYQVLGASTAFVSNEVIKQIRSGESGCPFRSRGSMNPAFLNEVQSNLDLVIEEQADNDIKKRGCKAMKHYEDFIDKVDQLFTKSLKGTGL